jgi:diguanylate cyclase (GGDEF)-like protein
LSCAEGIYVRKYNFFMKKKILIVIIALLVLPLYGTGKNKEQYSADPPAFYLTADEKNFLQGLQTLTVLMDDNYPPICYYNPVKKSYDGIGSDVLELVLEKIGIQYTTLHRDDLGWSDKLAMIEDKRADILVGASVNSERSEYGYFNSQYYFSVYYALIGSVDNHVSAKKLDELKNYKIGLPQNLSINEFLLKVIPVENITFFADQKSAYSALLKGEVDLVPENEAVFIDEYFKKKRFDFEIVYTISDVVKNYAFFLPKTDTGKKLADLIDRAMLDINISQVQSAHYENKSIFSFYREQTELLYHQQSRRRSMIFLLLAALLLIGSVTLVVGIKNRQLRYISQRDALTGAYNRYSLFNTHTLKDQQDIFFIDLDDFKPVNDRYGHKAGDRVLIEITRRLAAMDSSNEVFRIGGDEFILLTKGDAHVDEKELLKVIEAPVNYNESELSVGASIGYIRAEDIKNHSLDEILYYTDLALYLAKGSGKNRAVQITEKLLAELKEQSCGNNNTNFRINTF